MGVDVAEGGRDLTVWVIIDRLGLVYMEAQMTPDTSAIPTITRALMSDYGIPARNVGFDRGGGGKQYSDAMKAMGLRVKPITFGESAKDKRTYKLVRDEIYGELAKAMKPANWTKITAVDEEGNETGGEEWSQCFALAPEGTEITSRLGKKNRKVSLFSPELREELAILPTMYDSGGKQFVLPKKARGSKANRTTQTIDDLIGRSPDRSDALALANWMARGAKRKVTPRVEGSLIMNPKPKDKPEVKKRPGGRRTLAERLGLE